ncbi:MAG TPA: shikimate kinase [Prolixibacteraceae bacterium]|nr:shikimate kinase [Prolixibacteraceae bacterium]
MNLSFVDLDAFIEEKYHKTIPEIFASDGEEGFRKAEQKALHEVADFEDVVVATGGGAPCFFDNMEKIKHSGTSLYLNGSPRILAERLLHSKTERPLIKGKTEEELVAFINETLAKRNHWYKQADVIIDFDRDISTSEVIAALGSHKR